MKTQTAWVPLRPVCFSFAWCLVLEMPSLHEKFLNIAFSLKPFSPSWSRVCFVFISHGVLCLVSIDDNNYHPILMFLYLCSQQAQSYMYFIHFSIFPSPEAINTWHIGNTPKSFYDEWMRFKIIKKLADACVRVENHCLFLFSKQELLSLFFKNPNLSSPPLFHPFFLPLPVFTHLTLLLSLSSLGISSFFIFFPLFWRESGNS